MHRRPVFPDLRRFVAVMLLFLGAALQGQKPAARVSLAGTWTGTLSLDNGDADVEMQFRFTDSTLAGTVFARSDKMGEMEHIELLGDSIAFKVDRFEFNGRISGATIKFSMLMFNGVTRRPLTVKRRPDPPPHLEEHDRTAAWRTGGGSPATAAPRRR